MISSWTECEFEGKQIPTFCCCSENCSITQLWNGLSMDGDAPLPLRKDGLYTRYLEMREWGECMPPIVPHPAASLPIILWILMMMMMMLMMALAFLMGSLQNLGCNFAFWTAALVRLCLMWWSLWNLCFGFITVVLFPCFLLHWKSFKKWKCNISSQSKCVVNFYVENPMMYCFDPRRHKK